MRMLLIALGFAAAMAAQESGSIVGSVSVSTGKTQNPPQTEVKPEDECLVEGKVLDAVTGAALKKTTVTMHPLDRTGTVESYSSVTDTTGKFAMKDIDPGR